MTRRRTPPLGVTKSAKHGAETIRRRDGEIKRRGLRYAEHLGVSGLTATDASGGDPDVRQQPTSVHFLVSLARRRVDAVERERVPDRERLVPDKLGQYQAQTPVSDTESAPTRRRRRHGTVTGSRDTQLTANWSGFRGQRGRQRITVSRPSPGGRCTLACHRTRCQDPGTLKL